MSQDYYGRNGEMEIVNYEGNCFLGKITLGLWDKVGIPRPLSEEDTKLVARILRNYVKLQKGFVESKMDFYLHEMGYEREGSHTIKFINGLVKFFEESGGLMSEEEWCEKWIGE